MQGWRNAADAARITDEKMQALKVASMFREGSLWQSTAIWEQLSTQKKVVTCQSLQVKITNKEVVEAFESRLHEAVTFLVEKLARAENAKSFTGIQWWKNCKVGAELKEEEKGKKRKRKCEG